MQAAAWAGIVRQMKTLATCGACMWLVACAPAEDPAPLTFSELRVESVTDARAVLRFTTSQPSSCQAEHGPRAGPLDRTATDPNMAPGTLVTDHEVPLEDLPAATPWRVQARAQTGDGQTFLSAPVDFSTLAAGSSALVNHALGGSVSAVSSNFGGTGVDGAWGAARAMDGQMATEWATQGDGDGAFLEVTLAQPRVLTHVGFRSRKMADGSSIITRFVVRFDGGGAVGPFDAPDPDVRVELPLPQTVTATVFRMEAVQTTGGNTGVKELELLGP